MRWKRPESLSRALGWSVVLRYAVSDLRGRPAATLLNVVAIALAVAYVLVLGFYGQATQRHQAETLERELPRRVVATVTDVNDHHQRFTPGRLDDLTSWATVKLAFAYIELNVRLKADTGRAADVFAQSTVPGDPLTRSEQLAAGRAPAPDAPDEVAISEELLGRLGHGAENLPRELTIEVQRTLDGRKQVYRQRVALVGVIERGSGPRLLVPLDPLERLDRWCTGRPLEPDSANDPGSLRAAFEAPTLADVAPLVARLETAGYLVEHRLAEQQALGRISRALLVLVALFVGGCLVNAGLSVTISTAMRYQAKRHEIGVLRAMGLPMADLVRIFAVEALAIGVAAFVLAAGSVAILEPTLLRHLLARTLLPGLEASALGTPLGSESWMLLAGALVIATGCSLLGVLVPAIRACRVAPVEAMRRSE